MAEFEEEATKIQAFWRGWFVRKVLVKDVRRIYEYIAKTVKQIEIPDSFTFTPTEILNEAPEPLFWKRKDTLCLPVFKELSIFKSSVDSTSQANKAKLQDKSKQVQDSKKESEPESFENDNVPGHGNHHHLQCSQNAEELLSVGHEGSRVAGTQLAIQQEQKLSVTDARRDSGSAHPGRPNPLVEYSNITENKTESEKLAINAENEFGRAEPVSSGEFSESPCQQTSLIAKRQELKIPTTNRTDLAQGNKGQTCIRASAVESVEENKVAEHVAKVTVNNVISQVFENINKSPKGEMEVVNVVTRINAKEEHEEKPASSKNNTEQENSYDKDGKSKQMTKLPITNQVDALAITELHSKAEVAKKLQQENSPRIKNQIKVVESNIVHESNSALADVRLDQQPNSCVVDAASEENKDKTVKLVLAGEENGILTEGLRPETAKNMGSNAEQTNLKAEAKETVDVNVREEIESSVKENASALGNIEKRSTKTGNPASHDSSKQSDQLSCSNRQGSNNDEPKKVLLQLQDQSGDSTVNINEAEAGPLTTIETESDIDKKSNFQYEAGPLTPIETESEVDKNSDVQYEAGPLTPIETESDFDKNSDVHYEVGPLTPVETESDLDKSSDSRANVYGFSSLESSRHTSLESYSLESYYSSFNEVILKSSSCEDEEASSNMSLQDLKEQLNKVRQAKAFLKTQLSRTEIALKERESLFPK